MSGWAYERIADDIASAIATGMLKPGDKLPSLRDLCVAHHASFATVRTSVLILKARGLIVGQQGVGMYVADLEDHR